MMAAPGRGSRNLSTRRRIISLRVAIVCWRMANCRMLVATNQDNADAVVETFLQHFHSLTKSGKPGEDEWTVAAAIVQVSDNGFNVVSIGTGSKCVGKNSLTPHGDILHDGHAEVVARRGFIRYLLDQIFTFSNHRQSDVFSDVALSGKFVVKDNLRFWMVSSVVPCGDASIMVISDRGDKRKGCDGDLPVGKKVKVDIHRTGAKCLPSADIQDTKLPGVSYHVTGQVRTKPGRGDPTTSVSCSDKLARWNSVGLQGALLSLLINDPIFLEALVIFGGTNFSVESFERAINTRVGCPNKMKFVQSRVRFPFGRSENRQRPCPKSMAWNLSEPAVTEVSVEGRRLGSTKKKPVSVSISKKAILAKFFQVLGNLKCEELAGLDYERLSYSALKKLATSYQDKLLVVKRDFFAGWSEKPPFVGDFTV